MPLCASLQMADDVQIVSVERPRRKRKRGRCTDVDDAQDVVCIESSDVPQVSLVELSSDDVVITSVTEQSPPPRRKRKSNKSSSTKVTVEQVDEVTTSTKRKSGLDIEMPVYWTECDKCGSYERRYHLIEVQPSSHEWLNVCTPLLKVNFFVMRLMRIQNKTLWHRLQCERQLMYRTHFEGFDLNERLLYHTSRSSTEVICAEGLDQRLGGVGAFGRGIYFSDNPIKCNGYWTSRDPTAIRKMFACRVLLGDIKVYPKGKHDHSLVREPPKPSSAGGSQTYDSVLGNFNFNEFVVYNTYRVMPEYVIEYQMNTNPVLFQTGPVPNLIPSQVLSHLGISCPDIITPRAARPALPMCHMCGGLTNTRHCSCK